MIATILEVNWLSGLLLGHFIIGALISLALFIIGGRVAYKSDSPTISFIGFNLVVLASSIILSTSHITLDAAKHAATITIFIVAIMVAVSSIYPHKFLKLGHYLAIALGGVLIIEIICLLFTHSWPKIIDVIAALVFAGFVGYDWAEAHYCTFRNLDSAIDSCVSLYLDIINLFINISDDD